jgi:hypothetical protein
MPVQIKFNTTLGDTTITFFNNAQNQNYQFQIIGDPQSIVFDPGNWILKTLQGVTNSFQLTVTVNNGWNMVSIPGLHPVNQNVNTWWQYRDLTADVFKFSGTYQIVSTATPGEGYWMKHSGTRTYNTGDEWPAGGIQFVPHNPVTAYQGWNLIGGYENSVPVGNLTSNPPGHIVLPIYKWSGTYTTATSIDPGYGYWLKLDANAQIIFPGVLPKGNEVTAEYFKKDWGKIVLTDATGISFALYAVIGEVNLDNYELPPAPPSSIFDIRYGSGRIAENISSDFKTIMMNGVIYPIKVKAENMDIRLQDVTGKEINVNIKSGEEIVISNPNINKVMVSGQLIPDKYALEQNYPNPFNSMTTIRFSISKEIQVNLSVYNILGEKVKELKNELMKPGYFEVQFDASSLASGVYFYTIKAGDFVQTKKMILLK